MKPDPLTLAELMVKFALPEEVMVMDWVAEELT